MYKRLIHIPFMNKKQISLLLLPLLLVIITSTSIFVYFIYHEIKIHIQSDSEEILTKISGKVSEELSTSEINGSDSQLLHYLISNDDFKGRNKFYFVLHNGTEKISVLLGKGNALQISGEKNINPKIRTFLEQKDELHEIEHTNIYKIKNEYFMGSFVSIKDTQGKTLGTIGLERKVDDELFTVMKSGLLLASLLLAAILFIIIWLRGYVLKVLKPVDKMIRNLTELNLYNFDMDRELKNQTDLTRLLDPFNETIDTLDFLFHRLSKTANELGGNSEQLLLNKMEVALSQMDEIMEFTKINRELQRAEKMNAVGQLAASVAHEIRNPMTVVKGFLQIFHAKEHMSNEERTYIKLMIEEMNRAETIINDYLSLAKPNVDHTKKIDGMVLVNKVIDIMKSYAMMGKSIDFQKDLKQIFVKANDNELKQVLINIMKNAIEAMKDGGTLTVSLELSGNEACFQIRDTGIGMTREELNRLGNAFYSLKETGTGMGLMVCYQMVEKMRGRIVVESEKGKGTIFKVYIPQYIED